MKILVCVKEVLDPEGTIQIDPSGSKLVPVPSPLFKMNYFDEFAVEEALVLKAAIPQSSVDVISVGPRRSETVVRRCLGMGADHGLHILSEEETVLSPFQIASWIAWYGSRHPYDLILVGVMAEDDMEGQVGPLVAEFLSLALATSVISLAVSTEGKAVYVEREIEGGLREHLKLVLPAVLSIQSGINKPRYPSLSNVLRAKKQELEIIPAGSLKQEPPLQETLGFSFPQRSRPGLVLSGSPLEKAAALLTILRDKSLLN